MSQISGDESLDPIESLWYRHIAHCDICTDETNDRCLVGECIFQELLKRLERICKGVNRNE